MKKNQLVLAGLVTLSSVFAFTSCDDDDPVENNSAVSTEYSDVIANYVDGIVLPTYKEMKDDAQALLDAVEKLAENKSQANIQAACDAWRKTREPWEQSEAFLFGPAATYALDPSLDSWPLDKDQIQSMLNSDIDFEDAAGTLGVNVKGFHTIEYLLFEDGKARTASTLSNRHVDYLVAVTTLLRDDCFSLWYYWHGSDDLSKDDEDLAEELEIEAPAGGFAERFKTPNMYDQVYKTGADVIGEIVDGCMDISGEVGEQKIGGPASLGQEKGVEQVESWYSWNSLTDYENNIISIQHSYLGTLSDDIADLDKVGGSKSISSIVASKNADDDKAIREAIRDARKGIKGIPSPFRSNLNAKTEITKAQDALADLTDKLELIKKAVE